MTRHASVQIRQLALRRFRIGDSVPKIAVTVGYHQEIVRRWIKQWDALRVAAKLPRRWTHRYKLSRPAIRTVIQVLLDDPQLYYDEVRDLIWIRHDESVSLSAFGALGRALGYKNVVGDTQSRRKDERAMRQHARTRAGFDDKTFLFVDECHKTGKDMIRKRGKGRHGKAPKVNLSNHLGKSWSILAAMDHAGFVDFSIQELRGSARGRQDLPRAVDRTLFMTMFQESVMPHLNAYPGPCSVVIIDNASLHHSEKDMLTELVQSVGAYIIYTPPYCPRCVAPAVLPPAVLPPSSSLMAAMLPLVSAGRTRSRWASRA